MSRRLQISIDSDGARGFVAAWRAAEAGAEPGEAVERLVFEDLETLLRHLTPGRWRLLKTLRGAGPSSVRALAMKLDRDYKSVHGDVKRLEAVGLLERTDDQRVVVPWEIVVAELRLVA